MAETRPHGLATRMGDTDGMHARRRARLWARAVLGGVSVALVALALAACNGSTAPAPGPNSLALTQVSWCDQPSVNFQDDGKLAHPILTDWNQVKDQLGFTPYLPASLPKGTCLALVGGSIHDPIFGARFRITYDLPGNVPLSFSEAPKQTVVSTLGNGIQCSQVAPAPTIAPVGTPNGTPQPTPSPALSVCIGNLANTNVSLASPQPSATLQQMFSSLQPNLDWVPQNGGGANPTPTVTPKA